MSGLSTLLLLAEVSRFRYFMKKPPAKRVEGKYYEQMNCLAGKFFWGGQKFFFFCRRPPAPRLSEVVWLIIWRVKFFLAGKNWFLVVVGPLPPACQKLFG